MKNIDIQICAHDVQVQHKFIIVKIFQLPTYNATYWIPVVIFIIGATNGTETAYLPFRRTRGHSRNLKGFVSLYL